MKRRGLYAFASIGLLAHAQDAPQRLTFEVARVKSTKEAGGAILVRPGGQTYTAEGVPVKLMISVMYRIPARQIIGGPAWLDDELFDIEAKADHSSSLDDLHTMFQNLLADEFKLKFHKEIREGNVYVLTIDKSGLKMKPNETLEAIHAPIQGDGHGGIVGTGIPMRDLCWWLSEQLRFDQRPVVDKTGLDGNYDFKLLFLPVLPLGFDLEKLPQQVRDRPTIFAALQQQLGLKLDPEKGPAEYYVIDHVEKPAN